MVKENGVREAVEDRNNREPKQECCRCRQEARNSSMHWLEVMWSQPGGKDEARKAPGRQEDQTTSIAMNILKTSEGSENCTQEGAYRVKTRGKSPSEEPDTRLEEDDLHTRVVDLGACWSHQSGTAPDLCFTKVMVSKEAQTTGFIVNLRVGLRTQDWGCGSVVCLA